MVGAIEDIYRRDSRRVFSTLVRLLGSMDAAEEALHDAFVAAAEQWPAKGLPANPAAWLVSAGRFKAIDKIRRQSRFVSWDAASEMAEAAAAVPDDQSPNWEQQWDARQDIEDNRLRLIITCCHPSLSEEARVALTLREVCGLPTEAIASAFLIATSTLARHVRWIGQKPVTTALGVTREAFAIVG